MAKRIFLVLFTILVLCWQFINGQSEPKSLAFEFLYSETHIVRNDSSFTLFYVYRIPYDRFVFVKDGNKYSAGFRISIEVTDSASNHVTRQIDEENISANNFDETNSDKIYFEGVIRLNLPEGRFKLMPEVTDLNSNRDLKLHDLQINLDKLRKLNFLQPLIVQHDILDCKGKKSFQLTNFDNSIPFSEGNYDLIIPSYDTTLNKINVLILNEKDTVFNGQVKEHFSTQLIPEACEGEIILSDSDSIFKTENFVLNDFSRKLTEGDIRIFVSAVGKPNIKDDFKIPVVWFDKPFSLFDPKEAINYLYEVEDHKIVDSLLSFSSKKYPKVLFDYWKRYDPTKETEFNPLMNEFYLRVDYAVKNFATLSGKSGADTDRGKIFIKYGKPKEIERSSNKYGKVEEKWIYENPSRIFVFVDNDGAGNYTLIK